MLIVKVHDMRADETANNAEADAEAIWSTYTIYPKGETVVFNGFLYTSTEAKNNANQPDISPLEWVAVRGINRNNVYDVYPDTFSIVTGGSLVLSYNVTAIDTIFLGNIHGDTVTVTAGGTFTKTITDTDISPLTVWGLQGFKEVADFYIEIPPYTGTVTITITKAPSDNIAGLGFINYGTRESVGCTLLDAIRYNVRSGVSMTGNIINLDRLRVSSWQEMILPVRVPKVEDTKRVISLLAEYRGVPILIIGDDLGVREETIFYGVYTEIEASLAEWNNYTIHLRSLRYSAFVPPTILEEYQQASKDAMEASNGGSSAPPDVRVDYVTHTPVITDFISGTGKDILFNECGMYRNDAGTVKKCHNYPVGTFDGVPTFADFTDGQEVLINRADPCIMYHIYFGKVQRCTTIVGAITALLNPLEPDPGKQMVGLTTRAPYHPTNATFVWYAGISFGGWGFWHLPSSAEPSSFVYDGVVIASNQPGDPVMAGRIYTEALKYCHGTGNAQFWYI